MWMAGAHSGGSVPRRWRRAHPAAAQSQGGPLQHGAQPHPADLSKWALQPCRVCVNAAAHGGAQAVRMGGDATPPTMRIRSPPPRGQPQVSADSHFSKVVAFLRKHLKTDAVVSPSGRPAAWRAAPRTLAPSLPAVPASHACLPRHTHGALPAFVTSSNCSSPREGEGLGCPPYPHPPRSPAPVCIPA
jgi:hypothetical protein